MMRGNIRRKKKTSGSSIKIKPFSKPPSLPDDFYATSSSLLFSSLHAILQQESTLNYNNEFIEAVQSYYRDLDMGKLESRSSAPSYQGQQQHQVMMPSKEELYGKVQDLCSHNYGPKLYKELIHVLDQAAYTCLSRLLGTQTSPSSSSVILYPTRNCSEDTSHGKQLYFTSMEEDKDIKEGSMILEHVWGVYSTYIQFLNCVRTIFLSLDRMYLYLPPNQEGAREGTVLSRTASAKHNEQTFIDMNATAGIAWDIWDVGMDCLYKHMAMVVKQGYATAAVAASASASSTSMEISHAKYSILETLKERTTKCIIAELDMSQSDPMQMDTSSDGSMMHKSLLRDCCSIFRSLAEVSRHHQGNIHKDFLNLLTKEMTTYFQAESKHWMSNVNLHSSIPSKTSYDASALLHHIHHRVQQVDGMTTYYHLFPESSTTADAILSIPLKRKKKKLHLFTHLVEKYLLTPHFTPQLLLHPMNLFPILDREEEAGPNRKDAKLLFQLSKRCVKDSYSSSTAVSGLTITSSTGMELLRRAYEQYGQERGMGIMQPSNNAPINNVALGPTKPPPQLTQREMNNQIVTNLLQYKSHLEYLLKESFENNEFFVKTMRKILEDVLNNGEVDESDIGISHSAPRRASRATDGGKRIAELLAKFMDLRFKNTKASLGSSPFKSRGSTSISSASTANTHSNMDELQTSVLDLFVHIQSKDVFEAFYRRDLSKRLLMNKSASIDAERSFVSKLKAECGTGYTSKMEGMFKDMELSKDVMTDYTEHLAGPGQRANASVSMEVQLLTTGYWPTQTQFPDINLPSSLSEMKEEFETYYKSKFQGRRIVWQNGLGNCIVKANFPKCNGARELNVNLCQALVLLCFNDDEDNTQSIQLNIEQIMQKTGITDRGEAERILQSLSMGREGTQVLRRVDMSAAMNTASESNTPRKKHKTNRKAISDTDLFEFNSSFQSNQRRIRITNIQLKETSADRKKTHESVILDRLHLIDAAIVRIMKARKTLEHRELVGEVMTQLKFPANGVDIKKRIESLIEREYLERVEGQASRYNYLA